VEQAPQTVAEIRLLAKRKLMQLVIPALEALRGAIEHPDDESAVVIKAACAVLDRAGFGVHSTVTIDDQAMDIPRLTPEEHVDRMRQLIARLETQFNTAVTNPPPGHTSTSVH
jgi:hypothetical protein